MAVGSAEGQDAGKPPTLANPKLVYQLRKSGWTTALEMLSKLEKADKEKFAGILAFSSDVRRVEKSIDSKKPKHEWNLFETAPLLHRNPNFWRAMFESDPSESAFKFVHIGLLMTSGEIDQAHNLIHLLLHDASISKIAVGWIAAHQGEYSPEIAPARQEVGQVIQLWKESLKSKSSADDQVLLKFAQGCQNAAPIEIRFHELALVARQIVVSRKGGYDDQDRDFIAASLRQLVPGPITEDTLRRLKDQSLELFQVAPKK